MSGKVYFITGANRGIGFSLVQKLWSEENTIIASARTPEKSTELQEFAKTHSNVFIVKLDISSQESIDALDAQLLEVAPDGIDVFIANAGIAPQEAYVPIIKTNRETWLKVYGTNTLGAIFSTTAVYPHLLKKKTRQIFFISSVAGSLSQFIEFSSSAYGQSKAALNHSILTLALELKEEGFTVVATHPGLVLTDMSTSLMDYMIKNQPSTKQFFETMAITTEQSGNDLTKLFQNIKPEDNGKFYNHDGTEVPY